MGLIFYLTISVHTKSFHALFTKLTVNPERIGNFVFICDVCKTKHEHKQAVNTKTHVISLENKIVRLESDISDIKNILVNGTNPQSPSSISASVNQSPSNGDSTRTTLGMTKNVLKIYVQKLNLLLKVVKQVRQYLGLI